ncbi:hypothetical protein AYI70_g8868, partial [Smittium culicis]
VIYIFVGVIDAIRNISLFQNQYRHTLSSSNSRPQNSGSNDGDEMEQLRIIGDGNHFDSGIPLQTSSSNFSTLIDAARHSLYVSYGVLHDAAWEAALFGSNFLPTNYRMYIHSIAPEGPIAFEDTEFNNLRSGPTNAGYNYNQIGEINDAFSLETEIIHEPEISTSEELSSNNNLKKTKANTSDDSDSDILGLDDEINDTLATNPPNPLNNKNNRDNN